VGGVGVGLGVRAPNPKPPIPNPQSPIPNPQFKLKLLVDRIFNLLK